MPQDSWKGPTERDIKTHFIDPVEYQLLLLDKMYKEYAPGEAPAIMENLAGIFKSSDGFLVVRETLTGSMF